MLWRSFASVRFLLTQSPVCCTHRKGRLLKDRTQLSGGLLLTQEFKKKSYKRIDFIRVKVWCSSRFLQVTSVCDKNLQQQQLLDWNIRVVKCRISILNEVLIWVSWTLMTFGIICALCFVTLFHIFPFLYWWSSKKRTGQKKKLKPRWGGNMKPRWTITKITLD